MGVRAGGDHDPVDPRGEDTLEGVGGLGTDGISDLPRDGGHRVADDEGVHGGQPAQRLGVEGADPAEPEQSEAHT